MAVTNSGQKATNALLTLHYDNGEKSYEMQQAIQPGDQMWGNIASLIRNRVPDRKGNVLPADLTFGTYEVQDLSPGLGSLLLGNLALDGTFGFQAQPPDPLCCVISEPTWDPDFITFEVLSGFGSTLPVNVNGYNACTGSLQNISPDFFSWWSGNTAVAQVTKQQVQSVGFGTTTGTAEGYVIEGQGSNCVETIVQESAPIAVISFQVTGKSYIFVGTDPNELYGNHYTATDRTGTQNPQPPGGTCCADSSDPSDTVTQTGSNPPIFQFTTLDQSATVGDRTLTFEYDLSDGGGQSQQMNVTARQFAYATNNSPSNTCALKYGTNRAYTYTIYTHPDHAAVVSTDGISGTAVTESFNPSLTCETISGNGYLNANAQFTDNISSGCSNTPLTCTQTTTQTLSVAGYPVRTNTLQWTSTGVTYTSGGPTQ